MSRFLPIKYGQIADSFKFIVEKQPIPISRAWENKSTSPLEPFKNDRDRVRMAETEHVQFNSLRIATDP